MPGKFRRFKKINFYLTAIILCSLVFLKILPGFAEEDRETDLESEKAAVELLDLLEDMSEVATKTRLNSDFVPGMVTVLHGDDLEDTPVEGGELVDVTFGLNWY